MVEGVRMAEGASEWSVWHEPQGEGEGAYIGT